MLIVNTIFINIPFITNKQVQNESCDILTLAIKRYQRIVKLALNRNAYGKRRAHTPQLVEHPSPVFRNDANYGGSLDEITINLKNACEEKPHPEMSESCKTIFNDKCVIVVFT